MKKEEEASAERCGVPQESNVELRGVEQDEKKHSGEAEESNMDLSSAEEGKCGGGEPWESDVELSEAFFSGLECSEEQ